MDRQTEGDVLLYAKDAVGLMLHAKDEMVELLRENRCLVLWDAKKRGGWSPHRSSAA
jgi:hypothetical protein